LKTIVEQVRILHDLGILEHLNERYPNSFSHSQMKLAELVAKILIRKPRTIQRIINALYSSEKADKNYPSETSRTKAIIDVLNANESS
jgi:hypothetical protein